MAWICLALDGTLVQDDGSEQGGFLPTAGAVEAVSALASQGHRLTVFTSRFAAMPDSVKQRLKEQIEQQLAALGFPQLEVWSGTHKPSADIFIDDKAVTFDNDWGLALGQVQMMLEERGLAPAPQPDDGSDSYAGAPSDEEMPQ